MTKREKTLSQESRRQIYVLKQKFGKPAEFYKQTNTVTDVQLETGETQTSIQRYVIKHLVVTSPKTITKFEYDIGFLAANKNFTYGGFYEPDDLVAVIAYSDLPRSDITMKDYFFINNRRYNVQRFQIIQNGVGWIVHLRHVRGDAGYRQHVKYVASLIRFQETINVEL